MMWLITQAACGLAAYTVCLCIYRVYFSPLSRFPGPKLAAATLWYEAYYDLVKDGQWPWKIRELHKRYGPVVRINPREVHIHDPDYVDLLYQPRLDKDPWFTQSFGIPLSMFATASHDLHRQRRGATSKFFSKTSIASRVHVIQDKVLKLCEKLKALASDGQVIQIDAGFICLTLDTITEFSYGISYNYLDIPGFDRQFKTMVERASAAGAVTRQIPFVLTLMDSLPASVVKHLMSEISGLLNLQAAVRVQVKRILLSRQNKGMTSETKKLDCTTTFDRKSVEPRRNTTIFEEMLDSNLPPAEKSEDRLVHEGYTLIAAGSETSSRVLSLSLVHLLKQPLLLARLRQEIDTVMPETTSRPTLQQLEKLPFLTATIKEGVRLSGSVVTRLSRISPASQPLRYKDWVFPPGTPVSLTLYDVLMDENIFPKPEVFDPMRWLKQTTTEDGREVLQANTALDRYFVAFARGPRSCAGVWLAWAELYLAMAHVYRMFDMQLYETSIEDIASACDRFTCHAKPGNHGVRVKITGLR